MSQDCELLSPDCSPLGLIRKSLQTKETSWHGYIKDMLVYLNVSSFFSFQREPLSLILNRELCCFTSTQTLPS